MPKRNAFVDDVMRVGSPGRPEDVGAAPSGAHRVEVAFGGGRRGLLDMTDRQAAVWAEVLESLRDSGQPAYVEIDPETDRIVELLLPIRYTVDHIEPVDDGLEIQLKISHARHYLRRSHPDFRAMRGTLERALESGASVLVTETLDTDQIIDVQSVEDRTGG